jgi:FAD/FMN-containing dehydrogenase
MLLAEVDGPPAVSASEIETLELICWEAGAVTVKRAADRGEQDQLWKIRRSISPALYTIKPRKINEDIVVPPSRVPDIIAEVQEIAKQYGLLIVTFGHAGDGNIHVNILIDEEERPNAMKAVKEVFAAVLRMQGSISGEHGIGLSKAAYLPMEVGKHALEAMKKIKRALDPNNILNPGKIFLE